MHEIHLDGASIPTDVRAELDSILASEEFRGSQRCQAFLRHIVEAFYAGTADSLKERTLGIALFGRSPDYDTGADAIVRVTALETRRRLARYHHAAHPMRPVVITLTPGTYVPSIDQRSVELPPAAQPAELSRPVWRMPLRLVFAAVGLCLVMAVALAAWAFVHARSSVVESFWKPVRSAKKTILCTSKPNAYAISPPSAVSGDSNLALRVQDMLSHIGQPTRMAITSDLSESDLREAPAVLIGSSGTNLWTAKLTNSFRFRYAIVDGRPVIRDQQDATRFWEVSERPDATHAALDYAVITRLVHSQYGPGVIAIAGSSSLSTHTSGLALMSRDSLAAMLRDAPDNWPQKNLQIVICYRHTQSRDFAPEVLAAVYW
uniref:Adenylate cyclase n=2 Tax=Paracidobacterium acidisoli TaxID=2303751 RepID=A0A372IRJ0_9BACT